jgi:hypothetical protein
MATRYWVGGTGTWDASSTTNWSASSGGASGASAPVAADTVIFDSLSGTGTCTTASGAVCAIATLNTSTLGLTLGANLTLSGAFTLTLGALDLGNNTLSCNNFSSSTSNTRSIAFGTGNITLTGSGATIWTTSVAGGFSYTGTPTVNATYSGSVGTRSLAHGSTSGATEANVLNFNISAGTDIVSLASNFSVKNLDFTGFSGTMTNSIKVVYGNLIFSSGMTLTAGTSGFFFSATSGTQQITTNGKTLDFPITKSGAGSLQLQDNLTMGSTRTFTLTAGTLDLSNGNRTLSTGRFVSSNSNTRSILFGTGTINLADNSATVLDVGTATNFSFTGTSKFDLTYSGATGTRTVNGSAVGASESNSLNINITNGTDIVAINGSATGRFYRSINFTGFSGSTAAAASPRTLYGSLTISSGMTFTAEAGGFIFAATSGTSQITSNGKTLDCPITFNGIGGTFAFQDALTQGSTRNFTVTNGTVQLKNGVTSTVGNFLTSGTNQKFLQSTTPGSQATLSQASGTVDASYLTIQDINATGGATWNAFVNQQNVDAGNNDGWDFGISPIVGSYEYTYQLRSFTQPRRF